MFTKVCPLFQNRSLAHLFFTLPTFASFQTVLIFLVPLQFESFNIAAPCPLHTNTCARDQTWLAAKLSFLIGYNRGMLACQHTAIFGRGST